MNEITIRVPATSANLGAGFDTLGLALALYNTVTIREVTRESEKNCVEVSGEGAEILSCDAKNLAYSSARRLFDLLGVQPDFCLEMHNEIPLSRGLGSSAAACVGGITAANEWAKLHFEKSATRAQILSLATQLEGHPDNACAAILGGFVVSAQRENPAETSEKALEVEAFAVQVAAKNWPHFAVWIPDEPLPTKQARAVVPQTLSRADAVFNISRAALLVAAIASGHDDALREDALRESLHDKIHQNQRASLVRGYHEITKNAIENGAFGATLSGAGSTILLWSPQELSTRNAIERSIADLAQRNNFSGRFLWLEVDENGAIVV